MLRKKPEIRMIMGEELEQLRKAELEEAKDKHIKHCWLMATISNLPKEGESRMLTREQIVNFANLLLDNPWKPWYMKDGKKD